MADPELIVTKDIDPSERLGTLAKWVVCISCLAVVLWSTWEAAKGYGMKVSKIYVMESAIGDRAAVYFTLENREAKPAGRWMISGIPDTLLGISTDSADIEIRQPVITATDEHVGSEKMTLDYDPLIFMTKQVNTVPIPSFEKVRFALGGYQVMLQHPQRMRRGNKVAMTLRFARSPSIHVLATVIEDADMDTTVGRLDHW